MGRAYLPLLLSVFSPGSTRLGSHSWAQAQRVCKPRFFSNELPDSGYTPHCHSPSRLKHTMTPHKHKLVFVPRGSDKTTGEVKIYKQAAGLWFETIYKANSHELQFFDRRHRMSETPFITLTISLSEVYARYGPDIPHPEFPHRIMIVNARAFFNDHQSTYVWGTVESQPKSMKVSRIFGHCSGGLMFCSCIANYSPTA